ncbi:hypothetical protein N478_02860 [Pseudoalteromonas luteoviolacea S4060-1]|uniref:Uncharacterized protein n=1 Tax=Pseudoalteromonas luteoviolacea S4060-1 TaxID=1365257 RepID=A0A161Z8J1_9GAMM|nr:hypothetical protein N478_02860 [Pseudoalteromonas luteoviolacea S4060-1]
MKRNQNRGEITKGRESQKRGVVGLQKYNGVDVIFKGNREGCITAFSLLPSNKRLECKKHCEHTR